MPERVRRLFATAHEIGWERHVAMQAAFQRHTDLAVSKTVNLPHSATPDDVRAVFLRGHELGCKGVTVYRDGSRMQQVLASGERSPATTSTPDPRRRLPDERPAVTHKFRVGEQEGYLTVGLYDDGSPGEVFVKISKEGSTVSGLTDAIAILTSIALQYGVPLDKLAEKLERTHFEPAGPTANEDIPFATSIVDYIFSWLRLHFGDEVGVPRVEDTEVGDSLDASPRVPVVTASGLTCPDCGAQLGYAERCLVCRSCGYTKCG